MTLWLTGAVTCAYVLVAGGHAYQGRWGVAVVFAGYSLANIGLMLAERGR